MITVEDPEPSLVHWCEKNLIMANPQYAKLIRMGKKTWGIERNIVFYTWYQGKLILPRGLLKMPSGGVLLPDPATGLSGACSPGSQVGKAGDHRDALRCRKNRNSAAGHR